MVEMDRRWPAKSTKRGFESRGASLAKCKQYKGSQMYDMIALTSLMEVLKVITPKNLCQTNGYLRRAVKKDGTQTSVVPHVLVLGPHMPWAIK